MSAARYLVSGGAGFVGSHVVAALVARGAECVVVDDLSTGHRAALPAGVRLVEGNCGDAALLDAVLRDGRWEGVLHFAALSIAPDSMRVPLRYFAANVGAGANLIEACVRHGISRFVLSSTAAVYAPDARVPIGEGAALGSASAYGETKAVLERMLGWAERAHGMRHAALRYFNAAGADPAGARGEDHRPETHLIPLVIDAALGRRGPIEVFGTDYATPDGTALRDYIHVEDLAGAHVAALARLESGSLVCNVGTGEGHSVLDVIAAVEQASGARVPWRAAPRRAGDPPALIADATRLASETGWRPRYPALAAMVAHALAWRRAHPDGFGDG